ncbi:MAG: thioredoxin-disulfide reductase [Planctomycetia bacterium]|nr:thioredoxin-disulfide reductase [Planctomycetia bacterium]
MAHRIIIIGSGPAGWSAAIYAARAGMEPLLFEGSLSEKNQKNQTLPMGQLMLTTEVENYPGFPHGDLSQYLKSSIHEERFQYMAPHQKAGVSGPELVELMRQQAMNFGTKVIMEDVIKIETSSFQNERIFYIFDSNHQQYEAEAIIVATGARANWLGLPSEEHFKNRGVSACAVCDGALPRFHQRPLAVVGGGDSAMEEAIYLTRFASQVYLIHRRDNFRASKIMTEKVQKNPKITPILSFVVSEVLGNDSDGVTAVRITSVKNEPERILDVSGLFVAIGHTPNTAFLTGTLEMDDKMYIKLIQPGRTFTSQEGIFAAGDCADSIYRQAITSAATGCMAALDAERWLIMQ